MLNRRVERARWGAFFDRLTADHAAAPGQETAHLHVARPDGDASREDTAHDGVWLPFRGAAWDPEGRAITVSFAGLDHCIDDPHEVWADDDGTVRRLMVMGGRGRRDEVAFRMAGLPGPATP